MGDREQSSTTEPVKNIVLLGQTANGKSATGNSLVGKEVFTETVECQTCKVKSPDGLMIINVIDTPGLRDLTLFDDYMNKEISNCLTLAEGRLHAVVLVLSVGTQISKEEESALSAIQLLFGSKILDFLIVLFTGGDVLEEENKSLNDYLSRDCSESMMTVLRLCGGRRVLFDIKTTDVGKKAEQFKQLLAQVTAIEESNGGKVFMEEMHLKRKRQGDDTLIEQKKKVESKNTSKEEIDKLKKQFEISNDQNMGMMAQMMENTLKASSESQERMLRTLKENIINSHQEIEWTDNDTKKFKYSGKFDKCNIM